MKRITLLTLAVLAYAFNASARVLTVSSDANRPAMFTSIGAAVAEAQLDASKKADTIMIYAGTYTHSGILSITTPIVFIGEGSADFADSNAVLTRFNYVSVELKNDVRPSLSANGSQFMGIYFHVGAIDFRAGVDSITMKRMNLGCAISINNTSNVYSYIRFEDCIFQKVQQYNSGGIVTIYSEQIDHGPGIVFENCIFNGRGTSTTVNQTISFIRTSGSNSNATGITVRNSLFINLQSSYVAIAASGLLVENCIFDRTNPVGISASGGLSNCAGCSFQNNMELANTQGDAGNSLMALEAAGTMPSGVSGNAYLGIVDAADYYDENAGGLPRRVGGENTDYSVSLSYKPRIATTPVRGLTNGRANISFHPNIPVITNLNIPDNVIPVGGSLRIQIQAETRH